MRFISKKNTLVGIVAAFFMLASSAAFGAVVCENMKVVKTGTKVLGGAQVNVIRVQIASGTCGSMGANAKRTFNFHSSNGDAGLATALTALSLGQNVYLQLTSNTAANGTTVETIQLSAQ